MDPDQTALFASIPNSSAMLVNSLQQTTSADAFFLGALRVHATAVSSISS